MEISSLEQQILLTLLRLHPNGYGVSIRDELAARTGKNYSLGSIYSALDRLARKGFATTRQGEATPERGGRAKLHFMISGEGRQALAQSVRAVDALRKGLKGAEVLT